MFSASLQQTSLYEKSLMQVLFPSEAFMKPTSISSSLPLELFMGF